MKRLAEFRPQVKVDANAIYVCDEVWTSAGVTAGIDLALAMVQLDHGAAVASQVAANLVLYAHRPGFQSQFSDLLVAQQRAASPLSVAVERARADLRRASIHQLARWAAMSERTLHRRCVGEFACTPAKLLRRLRLDAARAELATTDRAIKTIASSVGFGSEDAMVAAFQAEMGLLPHQVRLLHHAGEATPAP